MQFCGAVSSATKVRHVLMACGCTPLHCVQRKPLTSGKPRLSRCTVPPLSPWLLSLFLSPCTMYLPIPATLPATPSPSRSGHSEVLWAWRWKELHATKNKNPEWPKRLEQEISMGKWNYGEAHWQHVPEFPLWGLVFHLPNICMHFWLRIWGLNVEADALMSMCKIRVK